MRVNWRIIALPTSKHLVSSSSAGDASSAPIDIRRVRSLFADPLRVTESDFLRREIANRMHERLALVKIRPERILDAGCGEGADLGRLQESYEEARIIGIDGSAAMLAVARERQHAARSSMKNLLSKWLPGRLGAGWESGSEFLCGDFAQLPLAANAIDLVWSNLALHWHPQPDRVFAEWRRVLRVDGLLMFSCFGPDTFKEVRAAFASIDDAARVLPFVDMHDFGDMLVNAGFSTPVMDMERITVTYESADKLLADMAAWGGNPLATRERGLLGKGRRAALVEALDRNMRADGKLPLSFEVVYGHAFRPTPRTTSSGEAIIRFEPRKT